MILKSLSQRYRSWANPVKYQSFIADFNNTAVKLCHETWLMDNPSIHIESNVFKFNHKFLCNEKEALF